MLQIVQHHASAIVVLHEIYGVNRHMEHVCKTYAEKGLDVYAPNLLAREKPYLYEEEQAAYRAFMENVGFDQGLSQTLDLLRSLRARYETVLVAGYSVGATIAWRCSEHAECCDGVIGYYGSRIRQYPDVQAACPVLLFLPCEERAFDVDQLMEDLQQKERVQVKKLSGLHGCCDPYSPQYDPQSDASAWNDTVAFLQEVTGK